MNINRIPLYLAGSRQAVHSVGDTLKRIHRLHDSYLLTLVSPKAEAHLSGDHGTRLRAIEA